MSSILCRQRNLPECTQFYNLPKLSENGSEKVAIIQQNEWQRIRDNALNLNTDNEVFARQQKEREELYAKSKELAKNWNHTIQGQRFKKLEEKKFRDEQDEIKKQQIDIEEEQLKSQQRKEAIALAKQQQYFQTDRVKKFHGALLLTEVLKERDAQCKFKLQKQEWEKKRNEHLLEMENKSIEEAAKNEEKKLALKLKKELNVADFLLLQMKDKHENLKQEKEVGLQERNTLKQQYDEFESANKSKELSQLHSKTQLIDEYKNEIILKKMQQEKERLRNEVEDSKIESYVRAKKKMSSVRRQKEKELFDANEQRKEKIQTKLKEILKSRVDNEDIRLLSAVNERERQRLEKEENERIKSKEIVQSINLHREHVLAEADKVAKETKLIDKFDLQKRVEDDISFHKKIELDKLNRRSQLSNIQCYQKCQMNNKASDNKREIENNLNLDKQYEESFIKEEELFQDYAQKVIEDAKNAGRNPINLIKAANEGSGGGRGPKFDNKSGLRPSYIVADATGVQLPHYFKDPAVYNLSHGHVGTSGKRLGFTW
ncbi:cilia- and flagella- associated protein 210 isoform X1 [Hydra vulgaris]|uniref:cilia- and flagella- associated protein 210 isoform X1 n=1 Tax=Hydra vulgaris TaxID=6087 RepID=UPI001F5F5FAA|nr:protein CFAP210 isoform X1 [Hydra vulgaris]